MTKYLACLLLLFVSACATGPEPSPYGNEGRRSYKVGKPYTIGGITYVPREDYNYDETGIASWYGPGFHGRYTANGETYDQTQLTAAHHTLPMPSLVRVTNLDNGKSIVVRINDRGPFAQSRILDMSERAATLLDFKRQGTAKVRVQILSEESRAIAEAARNKGTYDPGVVPEMQTAAAKEGVQLSSTDSSPLAATSIKVEREALAPLAGVTVASATPPAPAPDYAPATAAAPDLNAPQEQVLRVQKKPLVSSGAQPLVEAPKLAQLENKEAANRYLPDQKVLQTTPIPNTKIFVQAGAFSMKENAQKLATSLSKFGPTSISNAVVEGKTFYRVRIGPLKDADAADATLSKVLSAGEKNARVVVDR